MKIGFVNLTPLVYDVETPLSSPLGGSESAMCYLAQHLSTAGHEITLFRKSNGEFNKSGVTHLPINKIKDELLDFLIIQNTPFSAPKIKKIISRKTNMIFWSQHAADQKAVESLKNNDVLKIFDKIVLVSEWQKKNYLEMFGIEENKIEIKRNAISPAFENLKGIKKEWSMAYTSTPFRGLNLLPEIFEKARKIRPDAALSVFSSMKIYQANMQAEKEFEWLYNKCRNTQSIEYVGAISQSELASKLAEIEILAYPNTFAETSCISVMEAMAAGCQVVTSNLGALPETTAGFARLVNIEGKERQDYIEDFVKALTITIDQSKIRKQVDFVNENYIWKKRAKEWEEFLLKI
ncbi:MAG: glycosyltransferase family 4 protein [Nanoarchaeota archaeon]